jgi:hypothetical protein
MPAERRMNIHMQSSAMQRGELIRFVTTSRHPPYGHRTGIFKTAYALWRESKLSQPDAKELRALLDWFSDNLAIPQRFAASRNPRAQGTEISWVRASAHQHVSRLQRLAALIETAGIVLEELRTTRPGYVLYQDAHQVVALPFADTPR